MKPSRMLELCNALHEFRLHFCLIHLEQFPLDNLQLAQGPPLKHRLTFSIQVVDLLSVVLSSLLSVRAKEEHQLDRRAHDASSTYRFILSVGVKMCAGKGSTSSQTPLTVSKLRGDSDQPLESTSDSVCLPIQAVLLGERLQFVQDVLSNLGVIQELLHAGQVGRLNVFTQNLLDILRRLDRVDDTDEDDVGLQ